MEHKILSFLKSLNGILWGPPMLVLLVGALARNDLAWEMADAMNALMAIPNLLGLLALQRVVRDETRTYLGGMLRS